MNRHCLFAAAFVALLSGSWVNGQESVQSRLEALQQSFRKVLAREVNDPHTAAVVDLDEKYLAAVKRAVAEETKAGRLDSAVSLREEVKRMNEKSVLPETDEGVAPALAALRKTYREQLAQIGAVHEKIAAPLRQKFDQALAALQEEASKAGDLDGALAVKAAREAMAKGVKIPQGPESAPQEPQESGDEQIDLLADEAALKGEMQSHDYGRGRIVQIGPGGTATWRSLKVPPGEYEIVMAAGGLRPWLFKFQFSIGDAVHEFDICPNSNGFTVTRDFPVGTLIVTDAARSCELKCLGRNDNPHRKPLPGKEPGGHIESISLIPKGESSPVSDSARQIEEWLIGQTWGIDYGKGKVPEAYYFLPDGLGCRRANGKITNFFGIHKWRVEDDGSVSFGLGFRKKARLESAEKGTLILYRGDAEEEYPFNRIENIPEMVEAAKKALPESK